MCTPAAPQILDEFHSTDRFYEILLVSIWEMGEGVGVLILAPLSEHFGRLLVWHTANGLFCLSALAGGLSINIHMLVAFRFLGGLTSVSLALSPAIISDLFPQEHRGTPMALTAIAPLLGPTVAPIIGSYLSQARGWRWVFWLILIIQGSFEIVAIFFLRETYRAKILQKKTQRLRKEKDNPLLISEYESVQGKDFFKRTIIRPAELFFFSPIVSLLSIYTAVVYGYLYLVFTSETEIFQSLYGFSEGSVGLIFLGVGKYNATALLNQIRNNKLLGLGALTGVVLCSATSDWYMKKRSAGGDMKPEYRLPIMILGSILMPLGLFFYGWTLQAHTHWIAPVIGTAVIGFSLFVTMIPTTTYLVDAFTLYAASVSASGRVLTSFSGALLPLLSPSLYSRLGYGWGNSLLGFIALAFLPVPFIFIIFGERIRKRTRLGFQE